MRLTCCAAVLSTLLFAGCPAGSLGGGGTGSATGTGGAGGRGGATGSGGTGGAGAASPGTVTLQLTLPAGQTFCDEGASCSGTQHLWLMTASGESLTLGGGGCGVDCASCAAVPCAELPVIACPAGNWGVAVTGYGVTWDGSYAAQGSCEPSGSSAAIACSGSKFAPAGTYVARYCATPGTLAPSDGGPPVCTATGPQECVEVPFTFPSSQPVVITLPTD